MFKVAKKRRLPQSCGKKEVFTFVGMDVNSPRGIGVDI